MNEWISDQQLDELIIELVTEAKQRYGITEECSGDQARQKLSLALQRGPLPSGTDGMLSGTTITINQALTWQPRIEFTIFHEITHYLLDEDGRHYEYFTSALRSNEKAFRSAIERYCDRGAAEFLLPRQRVREAIVERGLSTDLIQHLSLTRGSSIVASVIQLGSCAPFECYVLICTHGPRPRSHPVETSLYVEYAAFPHCNRYPLARFAPIPRDHLCFYSWQDRAAMRGPSYVPFPSGKRMPCTAEASCLADNRVVAILSLGQMASTSQLSFQFPES